MTWRFFAAPLVAAFLAACTATGGGSGEGAQPAVMAQPASSDQQQRAKTHTETTMNSALRMLFAATTRERS